MGARNSGALVFARIRHAAADFSPLLGVSRAETEAYCRENQLAYLVDESNADTHFFRNRLRHEIIPALEAANPAFRRDNPAQCPRSAG